MKILFIGDIFGENAINALSKFLPKFIKENAIDFVIAQGENVSGRKGMIKKDYLKLKQIGINAFTFGNHVWAKKDIYSFVENDDMIRPYNIENTYPGQGSRLFKIKNQTLRVSAFLGIAFNDLFDDWNQKSANNFFDAFDQLQKEIPKADFHLIDFHGETTSEKNVFGLYVDGKANALVGTHTHVQTNDARILPKGLAYISDVGMTGPSNSAIGADYLSVYRKMRFNAKSKFIVSQNRIQFNGVIINFNDKKSTIDVVNQLI